MVNSFGHLVKITTTNNDVIILLNLSKIFHLNQKELKAEIRLLTLSDSTLKGSNNCENWFTVTDFGKEVVFSNV